MNYDTVILEMLMRIQNLENEVERLKGVIDGNEVTPAKMNTDGIKEYIENIKYSAAENGEESVILKANDIHRQLDLKSRMPMVCNAMRMCMEEGDEIVYQTASGYSSTLEIKYNLHLQKEAIAVYEKMLREYGENPRCVCTVLTTSKAPVWFYVFEENGKVCVKNAEGHENSSHMIGVRVLEPSESKKMLDIYGRRKRGENVSKEAGKATVNQVYWYGIFADMGL